ncbi:MAG: hypothetical protein Q9162_005220 [Coniocarpon cinnabarinum]
MSILFAFSSPYAFINFFDDLSTAIFRGPYWLISSNGGSWWSRLFYHNPVVLNCKVPHSERYENINTTQWWHNGDAMPESWSEREIVRRTVPDYVLDYAPLIHLYSDEEFWPSDIAEHLVHTTPYYNFTPITDCGAEYNLSNLHELNRYGRFVYLQSNDNVEDRPKWLGSEKNIPVREDDALSDIDEDPLNPDTEDEPEEVDSASAQTQMDDSGIPNVSPEEIATLKKEAQEILSRQQLKSDVLRKRHSYDPSYRPRGGRSDAPVVLITVPKADGIVDAFWFFFYSYNLGNRVLNIRFGNHVGDWEHTLVRFKHGKPIEIFFSEHDFGEAFTYSAVEKIGRRPVGYSGTGTHAMYGTPGLHRYVLPLGLLHDTTDRGPLWDPLLNMHAYTYDWPSDALRASTLNPWSPTEWFYFVGHWGDKMYPLSDKRQYRFAGQYHYVNGPLGPRFKRLRRSKVCQSIKECNVKHWRPRPGLPVVRENIDDLEGEEMSRDDVEWFADGGDVKGRWNESAQIILP